MLAYKTHRPDHGSITFAGISADADVAGLHCHGRPYCRDLSPLSAPLPANAPLADSAVGHSLAAQILCIGRLARPDILTNATVLVKSPSLTSADARHANDTITILTNYPVTLHFPRLDTASLRLSVYMDYSGSMLSPLPTRQIGFIILLMDSSAHFLLHPWASHRPHRVCRCSTAGELLALAGAVAAALDIRTLLQELLSQRVPMDAYTDSAPAYDLITSFKDPADMSGKNDLYMLRRVLLGGTLSEISQVHGSDNPADALSKPTFSCPPPNASLSWALTSGSLFTPVVTHTMTEGYSKSLRPGLNLPCSAPATPPPARTPSHAATRGSVPAKPSIRSARRTHADRHGTPPTTHRQGTPWDGHPTPPRRPSREVATLHDSFCLGTALASIAPSLDLHAFIIARRPDMPFTACH